MTPSASPDRYQQRRDEIDGIDDQILALLTRRAAAALEIGRMKRDHNEPIHVPERERAVLERLVAANPGPLGAEAVHTIFSTIIREVRALEEDHAAG